MIGLWFRYSAMKGGAAAIAALLVSGCVLGSPDAMLERAVAEGYDPAPEFLAGREALHARMSAFQERFPDREARDLDRDGDLVGKEYVDVEVERAFAFDMDGDGLLSWPEYAPVACYLFLGQYGEERLRECLREELGRFYRMEESGDRMLDRTEAREFGRVRMSRARPCLDPLRLNISCW